MNFLNEYKVDGSPILVPDQNAEITRNDLDSADAGRDESGFMHRILVRSRVMTWGFNYSFLTSEEYEYMKSLFDGKDVFSFTYLDNGTPVTKTAYCSNDSITYRNAKTGLYMNFKIKIIEC